MYFEKKIVTMTNYVNLMHIEYCSGWNTAVRLFTRRVCISLNNQIINQKINQAISKKKSFIHLKYEKVQYNQSIN